MNDFRTFDAGEPPTRAAGSAGCADRRHVAIVGAGFSGTMLAVHLARAGLRVTLIDRSGRFAEGVAYGTRESRHLLNVCAGNMSALAREPEHFATWLQARGNGNGATFAARMTYRAYLGELLDTCGDVSRIADEVVSVEGGAVKLASGEVIRSDAAVIAAGNLLPEPPSMFTGAMTPYVNEPWSAEGQRALRHLAGQAENVLIVGTGLTMIDAVLSLQAHGFAGRVIALSRRGLMPRAHGTAGEALPDMPVGRQPIEILRWVRAQATVREWRAVVDSLRPVTAAVWRGWTDSERGRFLRHLRPWWDVHRHRIAPEIAATLDRLIEDGRLQVRAGRIGGLDGERVLVRFRGAAGDEALRVGGIVNCTGPQGDIRRSRDPLISRLLASGTARADRFGLGFDVDADARIIGGAGRVSPGLYAVGPMTKGRWWEMVAVPDIRVQAEALAACIAGDLAVAGRDMERAAC